ncbi:adenylate cyclase type 10-like [Diadema antillarum]|uniref:adenylate cyclase type 10-like n=1 Tax=Diadema antillarum TaxID=105358 RepID=UPI003A88447A
MMDYDEPQSEGDILELAAHLPDLVLRASNDIRDYPAVQHVESVVMFLDIWGFTALCERHTKLNLGVDILTKTLNDYLGHIENAILKNGGDVVEFAGDALLVVWDADAYGEAGAMTRAIRCARQIQGECHDWKTESGVSLALKIALSVGPISITYVGSNSCRHYSTSGPAVIDANRTEKRCSRGSIVLSPGAWEACPDRSGLTAEEIPSGDSEMKLLAVDRGWADKELSLVRKDSQAPNSRKAGQRIELHPRIRQIKTSSVHRCKMRPFIAPPVLSKFDEHQSLDYLCEMREVTVVFISLHLDAAHEHSSCLQAVYDKIHTSVSQFQGMINKIFEFDKGTSFLVLFGLPGFKHEHEACHAVQCAGQIKDVVSAMIEVKQISIGVTTGKVFCGVVGHAERHEYTVIGPKVNMAARLMTHYTGKVSCDEETKKRSRNDSRGFIRVPDVELKGIDNPGTLWEYTGAGNIDNSIPEYGYPLLAYVEEFERCWKALWHMFSTTTPTPSVHALTRFIVVGGDPGVGKTRFMRAIIDAAKGLNMTVITCLPSLGQSSTPYHTICSVVLQLLDLQEVRSPQEREQRLQERFEDTELFWHLCLLNDLLGIQIPVTDEIAELSQRERTRARQAVLAYIVSETMNRESTGTLIAIDDAHYIDQDSWTYLEALPSKHCIVTLGMGNFRRDAEIPPTATRILQSKNTINIKLQGLEPSCMEPLLCQLLEMENVPRELTTMLTSHQPARINPSWVKQCVFNMLHHGQLELDTTGDCPQCRVAKGVRLMELDIPPSLRGCMIAFIDRLPELQRTTVKIVSVVGSSFTPEVIAYLMPNASLEKIHPTIGALQSAGVLAYGGMGGSDSTSGGSSAGCGWLRFQSITLQETAYALLLEKQRRKLHEKYATFLENYHLARRNGETGSSSVKKLLGKRPSSPSKQKDDNSNNISSNSGEQSLQSVYPQLVTHWRKANNVQKAVQYTVRGAESAVALGYNMQAISFIFQAKKLSPTPAQLKYLDELATKATACLLFTTRRHASPPNGAKFKWRNMATKARKFERSASIQEEEEEEELEGGVSTNKGAELRLRSGNIRNNHGGTPSSSGGPARVEDIAAGPHAAVSRGISAGRKHETASTPDGMAGKMAIKHTTTYHVSKYYIYAILALFAAMWLFIGLQRRAVNKENET